MLEIGQNLKQGDFTVIWEEREPFPGVAPCGTPASKAIL